MYLGQRQLFPLKCTGGMCLDILEFTRQSYVGVGQHGGGKEMHLSGGVVLTPLSQWLGIFRLGKGGLRLLVACNLEPSCAGVNLFLFCWRLQNGALYSMLLQKEA